MLTSSPPALFRATNHTRLYCTHTGRHLHKRHVHINTHILVNIQYSSANVFFTVVHTLIKDACD